MADIEVSEERELNNAWSYQVTVYDHGKRHCHEVTLGWSDYDLWCGGSAPPAKVVEAAFVFLLRHEPASTILSKFDCSVIRRYFPDVDDQLPEII